VFILYLCSGGVHYRDKETVSRRLALSGMAIAYGQNVSRYQGPYPTLTEVDLASRTLTVDYDDGTTAIVLRSRDGFEASDEYFYSTIP